MLAERGVGVGLGAVPPGCVPGPAGVEGAAPGDGVVAHGAGAGGVARFVNGEEHADGGAGVCLEVVPLVGEGEAP